MGKCEPRSSGIWMVFVRSFWDPIKFMSALKKFLFSGLSYFLIFKNFLRRTIKARNVEIDEGNEESVFHCQWMITYLILKSNRSQWLVTGPVKVAGQRKRRRPGGADSKDTKDSEPTTRRPSPRRRAPTMRRTARPAGPPARGTGPGPSLGPSR